MGERAAYAINVEFNLGMRSLCRISVSDCNSWRVLWQIFRVEINRRKSTLFDAAMEISTARMRKSWIFWWENPSNISKTVWELTKVDFQWNILVGVWFAMGKMFVSTRPINWYEFSSQYFDRNRHFFVMNPKIIRIWFASAFKYNEQI